MHFKHSASAKSSTSKPATTQKYSTPQPPPHTITDNELAKMPTISQTITALQLKFLGRVLRGSQEDLETQVCFTRAWVYRGGFTRNGLRKGLTKQHWLDQTTNAIWNIFQEQSLTETLCSKTPFLPYSHLTLHRVAQDRQFWRESAKLSTCIAQDLQSSQLHSQSL